MKTSKIPYKILRLRSGQDVITRIKGKRGKNLVVERPMQMQVKSLFDGKHQRELLMFRNWLQFSKEDNATIPCDWIAMFLTPEIEIVELYDIEKKKEDILKSKLKKIEETEDPIARLKLMKEILTMREGEGNKKRFFENEENEENEKNVNFKNLVEPNSIIINLAIPPAIFFQIISEGLLENFDFESIMGGETIEEWDPPKDTENPDWGNRMNDWSPDLEDYFEE
tara:strand:+ start:37 stop:711 length:675 start_codon:yes stop_codon:yes gene_type:complete